MADTVDAMTSDRPYRSALPFQDARNVIEREAGIQFDSQVAGVFLSISNETWEAIREQTSAIQLSAVLAGLSIKKIQGVSPNLPGPPCGVNQGGTFRANHLVIPQSEGTFRADSSMVSVVKKQEAATNR